MQKFKTSFVDQKNGFIFNTHEKKTQKIDFFLFLARKFSGAQLALELERLICHTYSYVIKHNKIQLSFYFNVIVILRQTFCIED